MFSVVGMTGLYCAEFLDTLGIIILVFAEVIGNLLSDDDLALLPRYFWLRIGMALLPYAL